MQDVQALVRLVLGAVFLTSAITKIRPSATFERAIEQLSFGLVGSRLAHLASRVLPICELVLASLLVVGIWLKLVAGIVCAMLLVFTALMATNLVRGRQIRCNCFGAMSKSEIGFGSLARNAVLIVGGLALVVVSAWSVPVAEVLRSDRAYLSDPNIVSLLMSGASAYVVLLALGELNVLFHDEVAA